MILMVYKEFLLPRLYDADYEIRLEKEIYHLKQDVEMKLEVTSGSWELICGEGYQIKAEGGYRERIRLRHQDILTVKTRVGDRFRLLVVDCSLIFW